MPKSGGNTGGGGNNIVLGNNSNQMWLNGPSGSTAVGGAVSPAVLTAQIEAINAQQATLRDQILQSEQNLSAQHGVSFELRRTILNLFGKFNFHMCRCYYNSSKLK